MISRRRVATEQATTIAVVPYHNCPAKTYDYLGESRLGRSVFEHCLIVGEVARALIRRLPENLQPRLFPAGSGLVAAVHDIGKVSPTFFLKLQSQVVPNNRWLTTLAQFVTLEEKDWGKHAGCSQLALTAICNDTWIPRIAGQHHGTSPNVDAYVADAKFLGGTGWQEQRHQLVLALQSALNETFPTIAHHSQALLLAGLTSVADWIGSGSFFEDPQLPWQPNIEPALDSAGFLPIKVRQGLSFGDIFQDVSGKPYQPNPTQLALYQNCVGAGIYVMEAPMGLGKTEAALYAAYQVLARGEASGIYFALPTQLTSNKIYQRFNQYLTAILEHDSPHRNALLLHGNAWLMEHEMGEEGQPGRSWFDHRKRGLLAPFAVGTLDQALMAAMNVRHGFVRTFGLAGKVVILDEVHSYDAYTSVILNELISLLRELHCTVIILSATLSSTKCGELLGKPTETEAYPLITALPANTPEIQEHPVVITEQRAVSLQLLPMAHQPVIEAVLERACQGEQILWIENSVDEAQHRYLEFAARASELDIACGLLHSRFTQKDRQRNEDHWVNCFGKPGWGTRMAQGRILIGTQVLEQSLDIDADLLVTRFAPTDMLLQRLGRLWRHHQTPRPATAECQAWILAPELAQAQQNPQSAFGTTANVYAPYLLCRSLEVWLRQARSKTVTLPTEIRRLLEETYRERDEQGELAQWKQELFKGSRHRKGLDSLRQLARLTLTHGGKTLAESKAQTRYSEQENAQLLLLSAITYDDNTQSTQLTFIDGSVMQLPWRTHQLKKNQWRQLAGQIMQQMVNCSQHHSPPAASREWCRKIGLGNVLYLGSETQDEAALAIALVSPTSELRAITGEVLPHSYRDDVGLRIIRVKE
ncbi:CRISPR-associated helicase Cas3' [Serratia microhaemolytica]|uniref:CRISPR-associated helicase Cas3' n=1 Tax=Serratia microhaemolytica TaxID=2675110 RepID=UPI000FDCF84E|nr:CRISPR-associated helicase Cas3' [Serratia microhaemolytica]